MAKVGITLLFLQTKQQHRQISWRSKDVTAKRDAAGDSVRVELIIDLNEPTRVACAEVFAQMPVQFMERLKQTQTFKSNM